MAQGVVFPVMVDGCDGAAAMVDTASVCAVPFPQALDGVTVIVPPVKPAVTIIEFVVPPAVFVHPRGSVHVYVVPGTFVTLYT